MAQGTESGKQLSHLMHHGHNCDGMHGLLASSCETRDRDVHDGASLHDPAYHHRETRHHEQHRWNSPVKW